MTAQKYSTLILNWEVSPKSLSALKKAFHTVHYHPDGEVPKSAMEGAEVWFSRYNGLPNELGLGEVPNLKLLQLTSGMLYLARRKLKL